ncbi:glycosyltransferase family 4 protein [Phototrophicus methaneseepsis]|uniref:Glycosyltransferase family 4 protein n=1 Tax=Phototrophicus methaneseepsis TaxID=2710758 RepID=A0A7S8E739_9CHLR|nr:glycosyltransferase family 4 protein [Phototrophicus methaneseepsis]QPC81580.1 glycosyltransferase family 4 protein [Phototrophicus methaneseepsis]
MTDQPGEKNAGRKLNIVICLLYYFPHRTGLTLHVQNVAEELVRRGHDVTVITARYSNDLPRDESTHNGVRIVRLWAPIKISRGMLMPAFPWAAYFAFRNADIVSIHTPMLETALVSVIAGLTGVNVIATHHGDLILPGGLMNNFIRNTMFGLYRFMAKRAAQLIAYSRDYAENSYYLRPFLDKVTPVYPPIEIPHPRPEKAAELRQKWQRNGGPVIGYSGRFVEEKRPDVAIRAMDTVLQQYPDAQLVFAGEYDIPYEGTWQKQQTLVKQHSDHLTFLGLLKDRQALADFYAACDVVVLPSDSECFALVQVEAMMCGTPMVMSNIPGGRVPVQVTGMGKLAEAGNPASFGEAIIEVLNNCEAYKRSREEIETTFSLKETVDQYETIFYKYARPQRG